MRHKILVIEDDDNCRFGMVRHLTRNGYDVSVASNWTHAEEDVLARRFDAVILGINLADGKGPCFIKGVRMYDPYLPIIAVTGGDEIEIAVDAVRCGADNVLGKPIEYAALRTALENMLHDGSTELSRIIGTHGDRDEETFIGAGPAARRLLEAAAEAAAGNSPILIAGETGTGKGLLARWMHQNGSRSGQSFAGINCSGLRRELLKAEIFGTATGAAGGEFRGKPGLIDKAGAGIVFLDEIGDMDLSVQAGLLARLQSAAPGHAGPGGAACFQLICSSNQNLDALVTAGCFLPDLLARIGATTLTIPPLRERVTELPDLARYLLVRLHGPRVQIGDRAMAVLQAYAWPGNVRELKNALEQGLILSRGERLRAEHFSWLRSTSRARDKRPLLTMSEAKEQHAAAALERESGEVSRLASAPGIPLATKCRKIKQLHGGTC